MEGWVDLGYPAMHRPRTELAISWSEVRRPNHYTTVVASFSFMCLVFYILVSTLLKLSTLLLWTSKLNSVQNVVLSFFCSTVFVCLLVGWFVHSFANMLGRISQITVGNRGSAPMDHQQEIAYDESNGHVTESQYGRLTKVSALREFFRVVFVCCLTLLLCAMAPSTYYITQKCWFFDTPSPI